MCLKTHSQLTFLNKQYKHTYTHALSFWPYSPSFRVMVATLCLAEQLRTDPHRPVVHGSVPHFQLFFRPSLIILECVSISVCQCVCVSVSLHVVISASCSHISSVDLQYLISKPAPAMLLFIYTFQPIVEERLMKTCRQRRGIVCWLSICPSHS